MPFLKGHIDWGDWVYGLAAAVIGGGASALTSGFAVATVDPKDFSFFSGNTVKVMCMVFVIGGILNGAAYLKQNSLPPITTVTTVETVVKKESPAAVVTTTVEKTKIEPQ